MKRLSLLLALMLLACLFSPAAMAATSGSCGTNITWKYTSSNKTLTFTCTGEGQMKDYNASSSAPWYQHSANIDTVIMNGSVTYIGKYNFCGITADFTLPDTIKTIASYGLTNCRFKSINMPAMLEKIGDYAFMYSVFEQGLTIPDGVQEIQPYTFESATIPSITFPSTLKYIRFNAFHMCLGLTELELPEGLKYLGDYAFFNCPSLTQVTIPASLTTYNGTFGLCYSLEAYHVDPDNPILSDIDGVLFNKTGTVLREYPTGRKDEVYIVPNSVTQLDPEVFYKNPYLKNIVMPDGITAIPNGVFCGCSELTHVELPDGITEIGNSAFSECTALTEMTIPYGVTTLGDLVFDRSGMQRLTIPETVTTFGVRIFERCPDDLTLCVVAGSPAYDYALENGLAVEIASPFGHADLVLPGDLTAIDDEAFMGTDAAVVWVPAGVTAIGSRAFADCANLKHINLPEGAALAGDAFDGCGMVYLYGISGGSAETYAAGHDNVTFVPLEP